MEYNELLELQLNTGPDDEFPEDKSSDDEDKSSDDEDEPEDLELDEDSSNDETNDDD